MITLLTGENSFEIKRTLDQIVSDFNGQPERFEGTDISASQLADILMGSTLFSDKRLIIVRSLSENKPIWDVLPSWMDKIGEHINLVLVDPSPDKRTKSFKEISKNARVVEHKMWGEYEGPKVEEWAINEAKKSGITLDKDVISALVRRVGHDPWRISNALQKISFVNEPTREHVEKLVDAEPQEKVFNLINAAFTGDVHNISRMIADLRQTQDPYMTLGLLIGQVYMIAVLVSSSVSESVVAKDFGVHPYSIKNLASHAKKLNKKEVKKIINVFAQIDNNIKTSSVDPWIHIENALIKIAST